MLIEVSNEEEDCDVIERFYRRMGIKYRTQGVVIFRQGGGEIADHHPGDMKISDLQGFVGGFETA